MGDKSVITFFMTAEALKPNTSDKFTPKVETDILKKDYK